MLLHVSTANPEGLGRLCLKVLGLQDPHDQEPRIGRGEATRRLGINRRA